MTEEEYRLFKEEREGLLLGFGLTFFLIMFVPMALGVGYLMDKVEISASFQNITFEAVGKYWIGFSLLLFLAQFHILKRHLRVTREALTQARNELDEKSANDYLDD